MGTVVYSLYTDENSPKDSFSTVCIIEFPRYTGPSLHSHSNGVPIVRVEKGLIVITFTVKESKYHQGLAGAQQYIGVKVGLLVKEKQIASLSSSLELDNLNREIQEPFLWPCLEPSLQGEKMLSQTLPFTLIFLLMKTCCAML